MFKQQEIKNDLAMERYFDKKESVMNKDHKTQLQFVKDSLGNAQKILDSVAEELAKSKGVDLQDLINNSEKYESKKYPFLLDQTLINAIHLNNSVGQIGCALEDISNAEDNVRRVK